MFQDNPGFHEPLFVLPDLAVAFSPCRAEPAPEVPRSCTRTKTDDFHGELHPVQPRLQVRVENKGTAQQPGDLCPPTNSV
jgi:hypothetical protein